MTTFSFRTLSVYSIGFENFEYTIYDRDTLDIVLPFGDTEFSYDYVDGDSGSAVATLNAHESLDMRVDDREINDSWTFEVGRIDWDGQTSIVMFAIKGFASYGASIAGAELPAIGTQEDFDLFVDSITYSGRILDGDYAPGVEIELGDAPGVSVFEDDLVTAGFGDDSVDAGSGNDTVQGGSGSDTINGGDGSDTLNGGSGDDVVAGDGAGDQINGGAGNDTLGGGAGADTINGSSGADVVNGDAQGDEINGGAGDDTLDGGNGGDVINGQGGKDKIFGGTGFDLLKGGIGRDQLFGSSGSDTVDGGGGNDKLKGQNGDDILIGGRGRDALRGGDGADTFIFYTGDGTDRIFDFDASEDKLAFGLSLIGDGLLEVTNSLGNTIITYGLPIDGASVSLIGVELTLADLHVDYF